MTWHHDIASAPRDQKLWLASECGKVIPTTWDKKRGQWAGFATNGKPPIAWQPYLVPEHPKFLTKAEEEAEAKGAATVETVSRDEEVTDRQRASESGPTDGRRQGGVEPSASAVAPAPHFILDDCGSGA